MASRNGCRWPLWLLEVLVMAGTYYVAGKLALLLAIPPGYATAVWPAAGVALAGILLRGPHIWPGILLGSFLINVWTSLDLTSPGSVIHSVIVASSIGSGASLQALAGAWLIRRFVGLPNPLTDEKDVIKFVVLGGPLSCVVSATFGVSTLWTAGLIQLDNYAFSWWTWWVGDTIGAIIFAPLILLWASNSRQCGLLRLASVSLPMILSFAAVVVLFVQISSREQARAKHDFERRTEGVAKHLKQNFYGYLEVLHGVESFFRSSPNADAQAFHNFVERSLRRHPGLKALSWSVRVTDTGRSAYEEAMRRHGQSDFTITERDAAGAHIPAGQRPEHVVVRYFEPLAGNEQALGFDLASESMRLEALNRARDSGNPAATQRIRLIRENRFGFLVFLPVYPAGTPSETVAARRQEVIGYAAAIFRIPDMIPPPPGGFTGLPPFDLEIFDRAAPEANQLLYQELLPKPGFSSAARSAAKQPQFQRSVSFDMAGRPWEIRFSKRPGLLLADRSWQPWTVLAAGLLFTGLFGAFLLVVTGRTARVEELVIHRTTEVDQANKRLQGLLEEQRQTQEALRQARYQSELRVVERTAELRAANLKLEHEMAERKRSEVEHRVTEQLAATGRMAARLAHEINNPLAGIKNSFLLIKDAVAPTHPYFEYVARIEREIERITRIVRRTFDLYRPNQEHSREFSLITLINDAVAMLEGAARKQDVRCELEMPQNSVQVNLPESAVSQVLFNLLSNAIEASPRQGRVTVSATASDHTVCISVSDQGPGIPDTLRAHVFEPFFTTKVDSPGSGLGLGLSVSRSLVLSMGGALDFHSQPGQGTQFRVQLPRRLQQRALAA